MHFFPAFFVFETGGALAWIYGLVLIVVVIYTILALRKQAKKAEDRNKRHPGKKPEEESSK